LRDGKAAGVVAIGGPVNSLKTSSGRTGGDEEIEWNGNDCRGHCWRCREILMEETLMNENIGEEMLMR
jgi:hypothetical protein